MNDDKTEKLIERLNELTSQGNLNWVETADEETYLVALSGSSISISRLFSEESKKIDYFIRIRDTNGKTITIIPIGGADPMYSKINMLFHYAKDKALNADEAIDNILKQLESNTITT